MDKEIIKKYLLDFQEKEFPRIYPRQISLKNSRKIQTVIGARRVGKTYLLYHKMLSLIKEGVKKEKIIYLNFESPILDDLFYKEIREIIMLHWSIFPQSIKQKIFLFIDEPQVITGWERAVRDIYDNFNCHIFITGSSSKLLDKEIASSLRGRSISTILLPLSFKEFLTFKNFTVDSKKISTRAEARLLYFFDQYLRFGGYPEVVLAKEEEEKMKILKNYLDLTIYRDLVERYRVQNISLIKTLIDLAIVSLAKEFSLNKHYLDLKSRGLRIGKNTLYEYFNFLEDSFFIFPLKRFSYSRKTENLSIPKVYLGDIGFLNLYSAQDFGQRLENIIFSHLYRQTTQLPLIKINYWKSDRDQEVDFVVCQGRKVKNIIQVCWDLDSPQTKEREIKSLLSCLNEFKINSGLIITHNTRGQLKVKGKKIKITPAYEWLLK